MFGIAAWQAPTASELRARFALGEHAVVLQEIVEPFPRGPRHQPRVRPGVRVRILEARAGGGRAGLSYAVEILDPRGRGSGFWADLPEHLLAPAPNLPFLDWIRSLRP